MLTVVEAAQRIRTRQISPVELTREYLERIERLNPVLNAFITVTDGLAMEQARQAEAEINSGHWRGPLHGIPIAIKDLFDTARILTTAASNQYRNRVPTEDCELVRLLNASGAVLLGKLNLHEFAFGVSGIISAFGPVRNPWDAERISGGSSSGSAAAVAAGLCLASVGTDTAGSLRCPAALCNVVGFRPSADVLGSCGSIPLAASFDTAGPITLTVEDAAAVVQALSFQKRGHSFDDTFRSFDLSSPADGIVHHLRVGIPRSEFLADVSAEVSTRFEEALRAISELVADVREVSLAVSSERTVFDVEIYEFHENMVSSHPELYDYRTLARIQGCAGISASRYIRGLREISEQRLRAEKAIEGLDVVITPTVHIEAPRIDELSALGTELRAFETKYILRNTAPFSKLYWPSISVPCGFSSRGLPVGLQISGRPGADLTVMRLAYAYEQATQWYKRRAEMTLSM